MLLRRIPAALFAALLALSTGIGVAPHAVLAAPSAQADATLVGYFESEVLPSADSAGLVVGLSLYEDGSAEVSSDYLNDEAPILEVGQWVENDDGTLTLTVTGTGEEDYPAPIDLVFTIDEDGSLVIPGAPDGIFGEEGLILLVADAPTDETADEESTAAETAGSDTAERWENLPADALVYQSEVMPAASSPGLQLTMVLYADNSLELVSDYMNEDELIVEVGTWAATDEGIELTLTGQDDGTEYDDPLVLDFLLNEAGGLNLVDEDGALFGEAGLSLAPLSLDDMGAMDDGDAMDDSDAFPTMDEAPAGVYVSDLLPSDDGLSTFLVALLYDDSSMVISTYTTDGSLPETEVGEWVANEDGSYALNIIGTPEEDYSEPVTLEFTLEDDGTLDIFGIPFYPIGDIDLASAAGLVARFQSDVMPAASSPGLQITLSLYDNFSVEMVSDYQNDDEVIVQVGEWDVSDDGQLMVTLTGQTDRDYDTPVDYVFDVDENDVLTLAESSDDAFGSEGLTLLPLEIDEAMDEVGTESDSDGAMDEGAADEGAADEGAADSMLLDLEQVQSALLAVDADVYSTEIAYEGGDSPAVAWLGFAEGSAIIFAIEAQNGDGIELYTGEWVDNDDNTYTVTLTEGPSGALDELLEMTLEEDSALDTMTVIDTNEAAAVLLDVVFTYVELG
jgi:hypothetical protein